MIFSLKSAGFCILINPKFKKGFDVIVCFFWTINKNNNRNSEKARLIAGSPRPLLRGWGGGGGGMGLRFQNFCKNGERISDFSNKKGDRFKTGGLLLKRGEVSLIFILTNPFQCYLSLSVWCVCMFCLFTPFLSIYFRFKERT